MKETIELIRKNLILIESTLVNTPEDQQADLKAKLMRINRDLRSVILLQLAINK